MLTEKNRFMDTQKYYWRKEMVQSEYSQLMPPKYERTQGLLLYYNDIIVDLLKKADEKKLSLTEISFDSEHQFTEFLDDQFWTKMLKSENKDNAVSFLRSHIFFSLLRDFIFYMHESFSCAERGKVTVAYTISRKPIKDTLFYLCWLLADEETFINALVNELPKKYDLTSISPNRKKEIIKSVIKKTEVPFDYNFIYDLIYNRKSDFGLSRIWDQSLHLVTKNKDYPTESGNLNFIFAYDDIWDEYWNYYYHSMPIVMNFAIETIITIFEKIHESSENESFLNKVIRNYKFYQSTKKNDDKDSEISSLIKKLANGLRFECKNCNLDYPVDVDEFMNDYLINCPDCGYTENVGQYYFIDK